MVGNSMENGGKPLKRAVPKQKTLTPNTNSPKKFPRKVTSGVKKSTGRATYKRGQGTQKTKMVDTLK